MQGQIEQSIFTASNYWAIQLFRMWLLSNLILPHVITKQSIFTACDYWAIHFYRM